jgi:hypothetical protein
VRGAGPIFMCTTTRNVHHECTSVYYGFNVCALRSTKNKNWIISQLLGNMCIIEFFKI